MFSTFNALVQDDYSTSVYLVGGENTKKVFRVECHSQDGQKPNLVEEWTSLPNAASNEDSYNPSLIFPNASLALFGDGLGKLIIIDRKNQWKNAFEDEICGKNRPFSLKSAHLTKDEKTLHVLVTSVEEASKIENLDDTMKKNMKGTYLNLVEWVEFELVSGYKIERVRRYVFLGEIETLEVSPKGILYLGEDKSFQLIFDSAGGLDDMEIEETEAKPNDEEKPPAFYWLQGVEDMAVWVMLPDDVNKRQIKVTLRPSHMSVKVKDEMVFDGKLWNVIDSESMTWTIDTKKKKLEITMCKANVGMIWQRFLTDKDVRDGEEVSNPEMVEKIHEQLAHLTTSDPNANSIRENSHVYNAQELEDCDENSEVSRIYMYIQSPKEVQKASVGDRQLLFSFNNGSSPASFCLRHDVDGLVWQPSIAEGRLVLEHIDTFDALGYVQASKGLRRFTVSPPKRSYVAIVDRTRHVYIYRKPEAISEGCELRNRKSGQSIQKVAKQQVPTLDHGPEDFIIGVVATDTDLFIATCHNIYCLKIH